MFADKQNDDHLREFEGMIMSKIGLYSAQELKERFEALKNKYDEGENLGLKDEVWLFLQHATQEHSRDQQELSRRQATRDVYSVPGMMKLNRCIACLIHSMSVMTAIRSQREK